MAFNILLSKKASIEIENAITYYSEINKNLGERFYAEFLENLNYIRINPFLFQLKFDVYREVLLKTFPFVIVFEIIDNSIIVNAVFDTSRNPEKK
ncbi:type II toxin-antitoxin system RelE/ParE family toxin [Flavobacterium gelidilacus]|uniref:type II toxin-antitoxin system RelE/ParE family toxin n=1 Tax=Flavobacterium gelidilacus TaxID=206041 RepID=UPI0003F80DC4|nr:type II toxin-antitoxin system RelE/ParE family toxin [Flavobacterium gelidilacus]